MSNPSTLWSVSDGPDFEVRLVFSGSEGLTLKSVIGVAGPYAELTINDVSDLAEQLNAWLAWQGHACPHVKIATHGHCGEPTCHNYPGGPLCTHEKYGDTGRCGEMLCLNYAGRSRG